MSIHLLYFAGFLRLFFEYHIFSQSSLFQFGLFGHPSSLFSFQALTCQWWVLFVVTCLLSLHFDSLNLWIFNCSWNFVCLAKLALSCPISSASHTWFHSLSSNPFGYQAFTSQCNLFLFGLADNPAFPSANTHSLTLQLMFLFGLADYPAFPCANTHSLTMQLMFLFWFIWSYPAFHFAFRHSLAVQLTFLFGLSDLTCLILAIRHSRTVKLMFLFG